MKHVQKQPRLKRILKRTSLKTLSEMNTKILSLIFIYCFTTLEILAVQRTFRIGSIVEQYDSSQTLFQCAIDYVNNLFSINLEGVSVHLQADDSFHASNRVCRDLFEAGVTAIFGPQSENTANHVQSMCDALGVPHMEMRWHNNITENPYSINLYPHPSSLGQAYHDLIKQFKWKKFVILYDSNEGLIKMEHILKNNSDRSITVRMLGEYNDWRVLLKELKDINHRNFIVDVADHKIATFLKNASQVGLMKNYNENYFFTSLNMHTVGIEHHKFNGTNIFALRLFEPIGAKAKLYEGNSALCNIHQHFHLTTEAALMYDAVILFARSIEAVERTERISVSKLNCNMDRKWRHGEGLVNETKADRPFRRLYGLTGPIRFDGNGIRTDFILEITELTQENEFIQIGNWTPEFGANVPKDSKEESKRLLKKIEKYHFVALTAEAEPYAQLKENAHELEGNDKYEGFCIDLLEAISKYKQGFNYTLKVQEDSKYGSHIGGGEWDGIIGELLNGNADLGIVDFTITSEREEVVDFTMPFMNLGIGIIMQTPLKSSPKLFSFMDPFSVDVWIYMATAYLGVSVLLFILARMSPVEWDCPHPCIGEPDELENQFTLQNSLWFIIGTFLCQGADIAPRAVSTRIVAGIWWFFTLIMISSYTANLAAFLTATRMESPIEGAEDLAKQTKIKYGCKAKGSTYSFFQNSNITTYQKMWAMMSTTTPSVFSKTNDEGVDRVKKSDRKYAFLMESASIEYNVERNCDLMKVGGLLDSKSYGIAMRPGSPFTSHFSEAILKLRESGELHRLKEKWWKGEGNCVTEEKKDAASAAELGLAHVGGVFVVMVSGGALACLVGCCEFLWKARKLAAETGDSFWGELLVELKFIAKCGESVKTVRKSKSSMEISEDLTLYSNHYGYANQ